jgi:hypothetical protein
MHMMLCPLAVGESLWWVKCLYWNYIVQHVPFIRKKALMFKVNMERGKGQNPACLHVVHGALSYLSSPTHQDSTNWHSYQVGMFEKKMFYSKPLTINIHACIFNVWMCDNKLCKILVKRQLPSQFVKWSLFYLGISLTIKVIW